jgi:hypothetical protein
VIQGLRLWNRRLNAGCRGVTTIDAKLIPTCCRYYITEEALICYRLAVTGEVSPLENTGGSVSRHQPLEKIPSLCNYRLVSFAKSFSSLDLEIDLQTTMTDNEPLNGEICSLFVELST